MKCTKEKLDETNVITERKKPPNSGYLGKRSELRAEKHHIGGLVQLDSPFFRRERHALAGWPQRIETVGKRERETGE